MLLTVHFQPDSGCRLKIFLVSSIDMEGRKWPVQKWPMWNLPIDPLPSASALAKAASNLSDMFFEFTVFWFHPAFESDFIIFQNVKCHSELLIDFWCRTLRFMIVNGKLYMEYFFIYRLIKQTEVIRYADRPNRTKFFGPKFGFQISTEPH